MRIIAPHLYIFNKIFISNIWLLKAGSKTFLVDTGHFLERYFLLRHLNRCGIRKKGDLAGIILTHRHSDHAGNAQWLKEKFHCPIYCHAEDADYLNGNKKPDRLARGKAPFYLELLCHIEDLLPARCDIDDTFRSKNWKWGFEIHHTPGHTEGASLIYHGPTKTLFSGDAILAGPPPLRFIERPTLAKWEFSPSVDQCHTRTKEFIKSMPHTDYLCSGHGPCITEGVNQKLRKLILA